MDNTSLLTPEAAALVLVDQQAGLAFGVGSVDRQVLLNNTIALARTAVIFKLSVVVSTSASKVYSGPLMPAVAKVLLAVQPNRTSKHEPVRERKRPRHNYGTPNLSSAHSWHVD
jgi:nicotinamidase-related amidase